MTATAVPAGVEYHRVLAGPHRRIGRGILAIALLLIGMLVFSVALAMGAAQVDGAIGVEGRSAYTPLGHAAAMASIALLAPWSMLIQRMLYGLPPASLHSVATRLRFDLLAHAALPLAVAWVAVLVVQYRDPLLQSAWTHGDVLWMLAATLLLTPLQAAGEEYGLRGLVFRVAGGWTRGARSGLALGIVVSSAVFAAIHVSSDPWLNLWYVVFAAGAAIATWRTGGLEVAIAPHAIYNTFSFVFDAALRTDLANVATDRSAGAETAAVLVPALVVVATAAAAWTATRRRGPARTAR